MKVRLPEGTRRLSHAGKPAAIAADGTLEIDAGALALLAPHGIAPAGDTPGEPARGRRRAPTKPAR